PRRKFNSSTGRSVNRVEEFFGWMRIRDGTKNNVPIYFHEMVTPKIDRTANRSRIEITIKLRCLCLRQQTSCDPGTDEEKLFHVLGTKICLSITLNNKGITVSIK